MRHYFAGGKIMGITVAGPTSTPFPYKYPAAIVEVKKDWTDDWLIEPRFQNITFNKHVGSIGPGVAQLELAYGSIMYQWETSKTTYESQYYTDWWVRISLLGSEGIQPQWVGIIRDDDRTIVGADAGNAGADVKTGFQGWAAYDAMGMLNKKSVSSSFFFESGGDAGSDSVKEMNFVPAMNRLDAFGRVKGNRSDDPDSDSQTYIYGGTSEWSRTEYIKYLLKHFADESDDDGPEWVLTGQLESLDLLTDVVEFEPTQTVLQMLQQLIDRKLGLDFWVRDYEEGFEIVVFATQGEEFWYTGTTLPANENLLRIQVGQTKDLLSANVARSTSTRHNKIRILGERAIICFTQVTDPDDNLWNCVPKWTAELEAEYDTAEIGAFPSDADNWRLEDKYDNVYLRFGAPEDFGIEMPLMNTDGFEPFDEFGKFPFTPEMRDFQTTMRNTLDWIPLEAGFDYSEDPAVNNNPSHIEPGMRQPKIWIRGESEGKWLTAEKLGFGVTVLDNEWGFRLLTKHNHIMALGVWLGGSNTYVVPLYNYETINATIAAEADHRLLMEYDLSDDGGETYETYVSGAELWLLAPYTVVGYDNDLDELKDSGPFWRSLRNDAPSLAPLMAGLIAKFTNDRARGSFVFSGYREWSNFIGSMLAAVEDKGDTYDLNGIITTISFSNNETTIKTGYA